MFRNVNHYQELGSPGHGTSTYTINNNNNNNTSLGLSKTILLSSLLALAFIATAVIFLEASPVFLSSDALHRITNEGGHDESNVEMTDEYYNTGRDSSSSLSVVNDDDDDDDGDMAIWKKKAKDAGPQNDLNKIKTKSNKNNNNNNNNKKTKKTTSSSLPNEIKKQIPMEEDDNEVPESFDLDLEDNADDEKPKSSAVDDDDDDQSDKREGSNNRIQTKESNSQQYKANKDDGTGADDSDENDSLLSEVGEPNDDDDNILEKKQEQTKKEVKSNDDDDDNAKQEEPDEETKRATLEMEKQLVGLYSPDKQLEGPIYACHENKTKQARPGTFEHELLSADCGLGYNYLNSTSKKKPWKVALYGPSFVDQILGLSGCLVGTGKCPYSPRCQIFQTTKTTDALNADVVVIFQNDAPWIDSLSSKRKNQYRVLYWREAFYSAPSVGTQRKFDFEMGVHYQSMVLNPQFFRTPTSLLGGITYPHKQVIPFLPLRERKNFAMSAISNCRTASQRNIYINRLSHYLGANRVHQFGRCGDRELPPPPIQNAAKIIATYKFYLAFENTIEDGYVTEKLLHVLAMPIVPVYYGSERTPNITTIPSFIKVSDFSHPKYLADYLLHLDQNEDEYYKYHLWRTNPKYFHPYFIKTMKMKSPGAYEMLPFRNRGLPFYPRVAACCRLCDENFVRWAKDNREDYVQHRLTKDQIERRYFQGDFWGNPTRPNK